MAALDENKRAQGRPGARRTRGLVCNKCTKKRTRAYRFSGGNPAFPAQWFTAYSELSPAIRICLSPSSAGSFASRELDANLEASGPHGFTVRDNSARLSLLPTSTASHRAFVTIAIRPSHRVRRAEL
jgi:hypothetical protein